jgi:hypothetical protein
MKIVFYITILLSFTSFNQKAMASNEDFYQHPEELILYNPQTPNAENLKRCVLINADKDSCKFSESPLIAQGLKEVTVEDILDKTMSSKQSYLDTFKAALKLMPKETLMMFGSVNAVVISERISPAFYSFQSGAIYLDASYFWKTSKEKALATAKADYRDSFGSTLSFMENFNYYYKDGTSLYKSNYQKSRTTEELAPILFQVLFHELSHANDFFPKSFYTSDELDLDKTYNEMAMLRLRDGLLLSQHIVLSSNLIESFVGIIYMGNQPTDTELKMNPKYFLEEYIDGAASDIYAYANPREDLAMLIENNLMYYYFKASPTTVLIKHSANKKYKNSILGGVKNKIAAPDVKWRSGRVLESIFGENYSKKVINNLDGVSQTIIPEGMSWEDVKKLP